MWWGRRGEDFKREISPQQGPAVVKTLKCLGSEKRLVWLKCGDQGEECGRWGWEVGRPDNTRFHWISS